MNTIEIVLKDFQSAPNGSILVKKDNKWCPMSPKEVLADVLSRLTNLEKLPCEFDALAKANQHFVKYAKSHFMVCFNALKIAYLNGEVEIEDESVLALDEQVLNDKISVKDAIERHPYLYNMFIKLYLDERDVISFPQV